MGEGAKLGGGQRDEVVLVPLAERQAVDSRVAGKLADDPLHQLFAANDSGDRHAELRSQLDDVVFGHVGQNGALGGGEQARHLGSNRARHQRGGDAVALLS